MNKFASRRAQVMCPLCDSHLNSQILGFHCPVLTTTNKVEGNYNEIYDEKNIKRETVQTLDMITHFRKERTMPFGAHVLNCSLQNTSVC